VPYRAIFSPIAPDSALSIDQFAQAQSRQKYLKRRIADHRRLLGIL
jgi:hypothetical protein